jgi:hypothetical protein
MAEGGVGVVSGRREKGEGRKTQRTSNSQHPTPNVEVPASEPRSGGRSRIYPRWLGAGQRKREEAENAEHPELPELPTSNIQLPTSKALASSWGREKGERYRDGVEQGAGPAAPDLKLQLYSLNARVASPRSSRLTLAT